MSEERAFETPSYGIETEQFILTEHFNRDVVVNPGDQANDTLDGTTAALTISGYDGTNVVISGINGLPLERSIGIHRLGDYSENNVVQLVMGENSEAILGPRPTTTL